MTAHAAFTFADAQKMYAAVMEASRLIARSDPGTWTEISPDPRTSPEYVARVRHAGRTIATITATKNDAGGGTLTFESSHAKASLYKAKVIEASMFEGGHETEAPRAIA